MAATVAIELFRGEAKSLVFTVYDSAGAAQDVTGWTVYFRVRKTFADGAVITKYTSGNGVTLTTPTSGIITVTLDEDDTTQTVGTYRCTLARTDEGSETVLADGTFKIKGNTVLPA